MVNVCSLVFTMSMGVSISVMIAPVTPPLRSSCRCGEGCVGWAEGGGGKRVGIRLRGVQLECPPISPLSPTPHLLVLSKPVEVVIYDAVDFVEGREASRPEEHLSHERAPNARVKAREALPLVSLLHAVHGARVESIATGGLSLETNLNGVKRVTDQSHSNTTENPSDIIY